MTYLQQILSIAELESVELSVEIENVIKTGVNNFLDTVAADVLTIAAEKAHLGPVSGMVVGNSVRDLLKANKL